MLPLLASVAEGGEDLVVQADMLLLAGTLIVDEAVLTGGLLAWMLGQATELERFDGASSWVA